MPAPSSMADLSTTAGSNYPSGSDYPSSLDDSVRALSACVKSNVSKGSDIASASSITIPANGGYFVVTGTTTITGIATTNAWNGREITLEFSGSLTLTNGANLVLPGGANVITTAGDIFKFTLESGSLWRCTGTTVVSIAPSINSATSKATPVDADEFGITDSAASYGLKKLTFANLKTALSTLYVGLTGNQTIAGTKTFSSQPVFPTQSMVRLNTSNGYGSTNTKIKRYSNVVINQGSDVTYADSATLGASFTINTAGVYGVSMLGNFSTAGGEFFGVSINTSSPTTNLASLSANEILLGADTSATTYTADVSGTFYLPAGTVLRPHSSGGGVSTATKEQFIITRIA